MLRTTAGMTESRPDTASATAGFFAPLPAQNSPKACDGGRRPPVALWVLAHFPANGAEHFLRPDGSAYSADQWDKIAVAGRAVRVVVANPAFRELTDRSNEAAITGRLAACRSAGQQVLGPVDPQGGRIPLGPRGSWWDIRDWPRVRQVPGPNGNGVHPCVADQIDAWFTSTGGGRVPSGAGRRFNGHIDGIHFAGRLAGHQPERQIEDSDTWRYALENYHAYAAYVRRRYGALVSLTAPRRIDNCPIDPASLRAVDHDYLTLWEGSDRDTMSRVIPATVEDRTNLYQRAFTSTLRAGTSTPESRHLAAVRGVPSASAGWPGGDVASHLRDELAAASHVHVITGFWDADAHVPRQQTRVPLDTDDRRERGQGVPTGPTPDWIAASTHVQGTLRLAMARHCATVGITEAGWDGDAGIPTFGRLPWYWDALVAAVRAMW